MGVGSWSSSGVECNDEGAYSAYPGVPLGTDLFLSLVLDLNAGEKAMKNPTGEEYDGNVSGEFDPNAGE